MYAAPAKHLAFLVVMACGSEQAAPKVQTVAGDLVFADVTIAPMDRATTVAHQIVVVRGDKIVAIAPASSVEIVAGAKKIDGTGKWLMPGLVDMHVHTWNVNDLEPARARRQPVPRSQSFGPPIDTVVRR